MNTTKNHFANPLDQSINQSINESYLNPVSTWICGHQDQVENQTSSALCHRPPACRLFPHWYVVCFVQRERWSIAGAIGKSDRDSALQVLRCNAVLAIRFRTADPSEKQRDQLPLQPDQNRLQRIRKFANLWRTDPTRQGKGQSHLLQPSINQSINRSIDQPLHTVNGSQDNQSIKRTLKRTHEMQSRVKTVQQVYLLEQKRFITSPPKYGLSFRVAMRSPIAMLFQSNCGGKCLSISLLIKQSPLFHEFQTPISNNKHSNKIQVGYDFIKECHLINYRWEKIVLANQLKGEKIKSERSIEGTVRNKAVNQPINRTNCRCPTFQPVHLGLSRPKFKPKNRPSFASTNQSINPTKVPKRQVSFWLMRDCEYTYVLHLEQTHR